MRTYRKHWFSSMALASLLVIGCGGPGNDAPQNSGEWLDGEVEDTSDGKADGIAKPLGTFRDTRGDSSFLFDLLVLKSDKTFAFRPVCPPNALCDLSQLTEGTYKFSRYKNGTYIRFYDADKNFIEGTEYKWTTDAQTQTTYLELGTTSLKSSTRWKKSGLFTQDLKTPYCSAASDCGLQGLEPANAIWSCSGACVAKVQKTYEQKKDGYTHIQYRFMQPKYRTKTAPGYVEEFVEILRPEGAPENATVVFFVGGEADLTIDYMKKSVWKLYGNRNDMVFIGAEHRGYGQSLSDDLDQSIPDYVNVSEAVEDYHVVATTLKEIYNGAWLVRGRSYCGALAIELAARYPKSYQGVIAASAPVTWTWEFPEYELFVKQSVGEAAYTKYIEHINNLPTTTLFDQNWKEREFLYNIAAGATQYEEYQSIVPQFQQAVLGLDTQALLAAFHALDDSYGSLAKKFMETQSAPTLSREEALAADWTARIWRYQQCTELGTFITSPVGAVGYHYATYEEYRKECEAQFGVNNLPVVDKTIPHWDPIAKLEILKQNNIPVIAIRGERDPWSARMLTVPANTQPSETTATWSKYPTDYGWIYTVPQGIHKSENWDDTLATSVAEQSLQFVNP